MEPYLVWALLGLGLVIIEVLTGTFYLLMFGVACFGAALAAYLGFGFAVQTIVAVVVASVGIYLVHAYRVRNTAQQMPSIDAGQPVQFESWLDESNRIARVRYRGAQWDATVKADATLKADTAADTGAGAQAAAAALAPGTTLYIVNAHGNTLEVSSKRLG